MILDNLSAHKAPEVRKRSAHRDRRRWHLHFIPASSSWLNLVERWFKELTDKRLRRGVFTFVADLTDRSRWAEHWNSDPDRSSGSHRGRHIEKVSVAAKPSPDQIAERPLATPGLHLRRVPACQGWLRPVARRSPPDAG